MAKVNKHGLKMVGLKKASGETENYGYYSGMYNEIFYDRSDGGIWTKFHCSFGHNSWTEYHDSNIVHVCTTSNHMTMQEIADAIWQKI